ncbi:palmitoyltransferase [Dimargaris cristalligena]|uniref:Synaptobrevin-like protein ykt6 n=1 Tax=Dimargaris cristalligena TaxID=215637 RepID=A0A4P9ZZG6_9FUNG|nr:palmitoyltransferase [Dimargaris cristalligena]RKP38818.1 synaptobrevin-like protein ykt6 [Dimargaris cristalligena]|eukprot:RKP38818.1 synaptobrevin-like protein ykt6 [Dimargaris cristalligena]
MKILSIVIFNAAPKPPRSLAAASDLTSYGYFQRGSIQEFLTFFSRTVAERTAAGQRQAIEQDSYVAYVYSTPSGLIGVMVTDQEYPSRVAFSLLGRLLDDFNAKFPSESSRTGTITFPELDDYLQKYQDPKSADTITRVQRELDETTEVLHQTIDSLLQRGETLEGLVNKSNDLSFQSKQFYKTAKKNNSCCSIM